MKTDTKPRIPQAAVEKAEALAGVAAAQQARARGHHPAAMRSLAMHGKSTWVGELELLPLTLQVQLCLMEHAALYEHETHDTSLHTGLKRLTRMAYMFALPDEAYEALTRPDLGDEEKRRAFDAEAFALARHFGTDSAIEQLNAHISAQMGLLEEACPPMPEAPKKKPGPRERPVARRRPQG